MKIRLVDLSKQYDLIKEEINNAIQNCIDQTRFIGGPPVERFEKEFAHYCDTKFCASCGNGTDALEIAMKALGIKIGDEVIVPAFTFFATVEAVVHTGATPVLVDIDRDRYTISSEEIKKKITSRTKAIIVVHLYGQMADMDPIMAMADQYGIHVLEDAAQAHGALYKGRKAGSIGIAGTFSFYPGKNLGAYGDGGAITTNDEQLFLQAKKIANHGRLTKYSHDVFGRNSRLDSIQASILLVKLKYLDEWNGLRQSVAEQYSELLKDADEFTLPDFDEQSKSIFHLYVIRVNPRDRASLIQYLQEKGIETGVHYPVSMPLIPAFKEFDLTLSDYQVSNEYMNSVLSLPIFPELKEDEIHYIASSINKFFRS